MIDSHIALSCPKIFLTFPKNVIMLVTDRQKPLGKSNSDQIVFILSAFPKGPSSVPHLQTLHILTVPLVLLSIQEHKMPKSNKSF